MAFLGGLGGLISPLITQATQARGGYMQGQQEGQALALQRAIAAQTAKRQQDAADLAQHIGQSTMAKNTADIAHIGAETDAIRNPVQKPAPAKHTPTTFMMNGKAVNGSSDEAGNYYDDTGAKVSGTGVYEKPVVPDAAKSPSEIPGTPEWQKAERFKASLVPHDPTNVYLPSVNKDTGETTYTVVPNKGPVTPQQTGIVKPATAGAGAQNAPQMAAAKANLEAARKTMDDFEASLKAGKASYGPFDATKGALGSSEKTQTATGPLGGVESFAGNVAGASLRGDNPSLAKYLKAKKFVAEAILNTHKRPNQTQYEIEQELSGIGPMFMGGFKSPEGASQIDQSKERRDRMWNEVFNNPNAGAVTGGQKAPAPGSGDPEFDALMAKVRKP